MNNKYRRCIHLGFVPQINLKKRRSISLLCLSKPQPWAVNKLVVKREGAMTMKYGLEYSIAIQLTRSFYLYNILH